MDAIKLMDEKFSLLLIRRSLVLRMNKYVKTLDFVDKSRVFDAYIR